MTDTFYADLIPSGQPITATNPGKDQPFYIRVHKHIPALVPYFESITDQNCYFALGAYRGHDAPKDLIKPIKNNLYGPPVGGRAWGFDLDVGAGDDKFDSLEAAGDALTEAISSGAILDPTWIVFTGGGLQFFYSLPTGEVLDNERWQFYRRSLRAKMISVFDGKLDLKPGSTLHSWFRAPDTTNIKYAEPRSTQIVHEGSQYDEKALSKLVEGVEAPKKAKGRGPTRTESTVSAYDRVSTHDLNKACGFMRGQYNSGGKHTTEPVWCMVANIAGHTLDPENYFHECSVNWVGRDEQGELTGDTYDYDAAQAKYEHITGAASAGPWACGESNSPHCKKCWASQNPKIKNPIEAARYWEKNGTQAFNESQVQPEQPMLKAHEEDTDEPAINFDKGLYEDVNSEPVLPVAYNYRVDEDGDTQRLGIRGFRADFTDNKLYFTIQGREEMVGDLLMVTRTQYNQSDSQTMTYLGKPYKAQFPIAGELLGSPQRLAPALTAIGLQCRLPDHMSRWLQGLAFSQSMFEECDKMGWSPDFKGFHAPQGSVVGPETYPGVDVTHVAKKWYGQKGDVDQWIDAIQMLNRPTQMPARIALLTSLAAPLVSFLGQENGMVFSLYGESGVGKSTAMMVANSVWGKPLESLGRYSDSDKSLPRTIGVTHHLPVTVDEFTTVDPKVLEIFTMCMTQGEYRTTLQPTRHFRSSDQWKTIMMTTGNCSYMSLINGVGNARGAELARVFEIEMPAQPDDYEAGDDMKEALKNAHGVFGAAFIETLIDMHPHEVWRQASMDVKHSLRDMKGIKIGNERFWESLAVCAYVAHRVAKETHADFPGEPIDTVHWFVEQMGRLRTRIHSLKEQTLVSFDDFLSYFRTNNLIKQSKNGNYKVTEVNDLVLFQREEHYIIEVTSFKRWCKKQGFNSNDLKEHWIASGELAQVGGTKENPEYETRASNLEKMMVNGHSMGRTKVMVAVSLDVVAEIGHKRIKFEDLKRHEFKSRQAQT